MPDALTTRQIENIYPLSPLQQGILFHSLLVPEERLYVVQIRYAIHGDLDVEAFGAAWQSVVDRHAIFRTLVMWEDLEEPLQVVYRHVELPLAFHDLRELEGERQEQRVMQILKEDRQEGFDLQRAPLVRLIVLRTAEREYQMIWGFHHIIIDGWSKSVVLKEVMELYEARLRGEDVLLPAAIPFHGYIDWLQKQDQRSAERFWRERLHGYTEPLSISIDGDPLPGDNREEHMAEQGIEISESSGMELQRLVRESKITLYTVVQAAWSMVLSRYGNVTDLVYGMVTSVRPPSMMDIERAVGLFINTLPVRVQLAAGETVNALLRRLHDEQMELLHYNYSSLIRIQEWSQVPKNLPLFESVVVYFNYPRDAYRSEDQCGLTIDRTDATEWSNYPLVLVAVPGRKLSLNIRYDHRRFSDAAIGRMLGHLRMLLEGMAVDPECEVAQLPMMTDEERHRILTEWTPIPRDVDEEITATLPELFELQAGRTPDAVALVYEDRQLSYRQINERANRLARYLRSLGVAPESLVAICMERSFDMVVATIAVLKAGGAYLPLDPAYPEERLAFMLEDAAPCVLLTQQKLLSLFGNGEPAATESAVRAKPVPLCVDTEWERMERFDSSNLPPVVTSSNLAYVIYTSGSTGKPKGTLVTHANVVRLFTATERAFGFNESDVWTLFHSNAFDFSVWELWGALLYGGRVVLIPYLLSRSPDAFYELLERQGVTVLNQTPSAFMQLVNLEASSDIRKDLSLRLVIFGGEALDLPSLRPWFDIHGDRRPQLVNMYGITETTVHVTCRPLLRDDAGTARSVIGHGLDDLRIYLLDRNLELVPEGIAGEICVAGAGLSRGYLNRPGATAERFVPNPYTSLPGDRLYRSGDLGRYRPDGELEYLGRIDEQVKLRGFRIELGEIETLLREHPSIGDCKVLLHAVGADGEGKEKQLIAYLTPRDGEIPPAAELRGYLKEKLPEYMVPSFFVGVEAMPLTPNGKIDRTWLAGIRHENLHTGEDYESPRTPLEVSIAAIWSEVLHRERVGRQENFFECGGHSILATQVISRMRSALHLECSLADFFDSPTVGELAEVLERRRVQHRPVSITRAGRESYRLQPPSSDPSRQQEANT